MHACVRTDLLSSRHVRLAQHFHRIELPLPVVVLLPLLLRRQEEAGPACAPHEEDAAEGALPNHLRGWLVISMTACYQVLNRPGAACAFSMVRTSVP